MGGGGGLGCHSLSNVAVTQVETHRAPVCPRPSLLRPLCRQLSHRAREIFSKFLCSKATTPVNIDSQAQLADDILNAPHPDMFKEQQLQVTCSHAAPHPWSLRETTFSGDTARMSSS